MRFFARMSVSDIRDCIAALGFSKRDPWRHFAPPAQDVLDGSE
jgi:hypothetical protein